MTPQTTNNQNGGKEKEYEKRIIDYLQQSPSGLTITDIHNGINASRITVSKYISVLEAKGKVFSKKIGAYKLYFNTKRSFIPKTPMLAYYAGILTSIKSEFSDVEKLKQFGYIIADFMTFPLASSLPKGTIPGKPGTVKKFLDAYIGIYPHLDLTMDKSVKIEYDLSDDGYSAIFRLKNVKVFDISKNFDTHFHIISGINEKVFSKIISREVECNVQKIDTDEKTVEISVKLKNN